MTPKVHAIIVNAGLFFKKVNGNVIDNLIKGIRFISALSPLQSLKGNCHPKNAEKLIALCFKTILYIFRLDD